MPTSSYNLISKYQDWLIISVLEGPLSGIPDVQMTASLHECLIECMDPRWGELEIGKCLRDLHESRMVIHSHLCEVALCETGERDTLNVICGND